MSGLISERGTSSTGFPVAGPDGEHLALDQELVDLTRFGRRRRRCRGEMDEHRIDDAVWRPLVR